MLHQNKTPVLVESPHRTPCILSSYQPFSSSGKHSAQQTSRHYGIGDTCNKAMIEDWKNPRTWSMISRKYTSPSMHILHVHKSLVKPVSSHQGIVCPLFSNAPSIEDNDLRCMPYGAQSMRDHQSRSTIH